MAVRCHFLENADIEPFVQPEPATRRNAIPRPGWLMHAFANHGRGRIFVGRLVCHRINTTPFGCGLDCLHLTFTLLDNH